METFVKKRNENQINEPFNPLFSTKNTFNSHEKDKFMQIQACQNIFTLQPHFGDHFNDKLHVFTRFSIQIEGIPDTNWQSKSHTQFGSHVRKRA